MPKLLQTREDGAMKSSQLVCDHVTTAQYSLNSYCNSWAVFPDAAFHNDFNVAEDYCERH